MVSLCIERVPLRTEYLPVKNIDRGTPGRGISRKQCSCRSSTMLAFKIRLLLMQPSRRAPSDPRQLEKSSCSLDLGRHPATCHRLSALGVSYLSPKKTLTDPSSSHKDQIQSMWKLSRSTHPRIKFLLIRMMSIVSISIAQKMRFTLCKIVLSMQYLSIKRLSTPSDQRFTQLHILMRDQKPYTSSS